MSDDGQKETDSPDIKIERVTDQGDELAQDALKLLRINFYTLTIVIGFVAFSTRGLSGEFTFDIQDFMASSYTLWGMASWLGSCSLAVILYYRGRVRSWAALGDRADLENIGDDPLFPTVMILLTVISIYSFAIGGYEGVIGHPIPITSAISGAYFPYLAITFTLLAIFAVRNGSHWIGKAGGQVKQKSKSAVQIGIKIGDSTLPPWNAPEEGEPAVEEEVDS